MKKTYLKYFLAMFAIISILYLTACGGGGGGNSVAPTPVAPSVRIIVDGSIFGDLASIRVSNRKIAENKQFSSEPFVKKEKLQNDRTSIKPIKGVEDKNEIKFGKISNFKNQKALLAEKKQIVNEAKKAKSAANLNKGLRPSVEAELKVNLALPLIIKTTAYSNGKPVAGVVIDDRTATASGTNYVCDITGLNNSYDYRFAAYYNNKMLMQNQIASNEVNSGKNVNVNINTSYKVLAYEAWVETCSNGGTLASFTENCRKAGIDLNKEDSFASLSTISANDYIEALKKIVKGEEAVIPTSKEVDVSRIPVPAYNPTNQGENDTSIQPLNPVYLYSNIMDNIDFSAYSASDYNISYEDSCYLNNQGVSVPYYCLNPQFYMTYGLADISGTNVISNNAKEKITNAITVTNVTTNTVIDNSKISKLWNGEHLTVSFNEFLNANTEYLIAIPEFTFENYTISAYNFSFKTYKEQVINKKNRTYVVFKIENYQNDTYHADNIVGRSNFTMIFEPDYQFSESDKAKISSAIHIVKVGNGGVEIGKVNDKKVVKNWLNNKLTISFKENLDENSRYEIQLNKSELTEPINFEPAFGGYTFYTTYNDIQAVNCSITARGKMSDDRYSLRPGFYVKLPDGFTMIGSELAQSISFISLKDSKNINFHTDCSNNNACRCNDTNIYIDELLESDTEYRISFSYKTIFHDNVKNKHYYLMPTTFDFKTIPVIVATVVPSEDSVLANGLCLKPTFTVNIEPKYELSYLNFTLTYNNSSRTFSTSKKENGIYTLSVDQKLPYDTECVISSSVPGGWYYNGSSSDRVDVTSNIYDFKTTNIQDLSYEIVPNEGSIVENSVGGDYYNLNPSFTIKFNRNYTFNNTTRELAGKLVSFRKVNSDNTYDNLTCCKIWNGNNLVIEFGNQLDFDSTYEVSVKKLDENSVGVYENNYGLRISDSKFRFNTKKDISFTFTLTSNEGNILEDNLYRLCPTFTVCGNSANAIVKCIKVKKASGELVTNYLTRTIVDENNHVVGISISFDDINYCQLQGNTEYTISMDKEITIYGSSKITPFNDFTFKTINKSCELRFGTPINHFGAAALVGDVVYISSNPTIYINIEPDWLNFPRWGDTLGLFSSITLKDTYTGDVIPLFYAGGDNSDYEYYQNKPHGFMTWFNKGEAGYQMYHNLFGIKVELNNLKSGHRYVFNNESKILGSYLLIKETLTSGFTVR